MAANVDVIADDLGVITERLQPYAPHEETRRKLSDLWEEYRMRLDRMESLFEGERLSCPLHGDCEEVIIKGDGRGDTKQYRCKKYHDPEVTGRETTQFQFSTFTSHEAYQVYQDFLVDALSLLTTCEGTYEGVAAYLNLSKHLVELGVGAVLDYLDDQPNHTPGIDLEEDADQVVVYADFSSTRVTKSLGLIMARVEGEVCYYTCPTINRLTAWNFVKAIREELGDTDATVVFVTDGELAWIDPIQSFFPGAVHIRQFHSQNSRGIIFTHLRVDGQPYTVRCRWDAMLEAGTPSEGAKRMRRRRALEPENQRSVNKRSESDGWTSLSADVIVWEGIVKYPRGTRRKSSSTDEDEDGSAAAGDAEATDEADPDSTDATDDEEEATPPEVMDSPDALEGADGIASGEADGSSEPAGGLAAEDEKSEETADPESETAITSGTDGVKRVFKGPIEEARAHPAAARALDCLEEVFGGHFITSNVAEALFHLKPALTAHRTVKSGDAFVQLFLFLRTQVRGMDREAMRSFFREEVLTLKRLRKLGVRRFGPADEASDPQAVVREACRAGKAVVIGYADRFGRRTSRMIEPLALEEDAYSGMKAIHSYCYLRDDERTFLLGRIEDAIPADTELSFVSDQSP